MGLEEIKKIIKNGNYGVVFPKARRDENAAMELADMIDKAIAVASFTDDENEEVSYGVIVEMIGIDGNGKM